MTKDEFITKLISRKDSIEWEYAQTLDNIPPTFTTKFAHLQLIEKNIPYRVQLNIVKVHSFPNSYYFLCVYSESSFIGLIEENDLENANLLRDLYHNNSPTFLDQELEKIAQAPMWEE